MLDEIVEWLKELEMGQYAVSFGEDSVDGAEFTGEDLMLLTDTAVGHRCRLHAALAAAPAMNLVLVGNVIQLRAVLAFFLVLVLAANSSVSTSAPRFSNLQILPEDASTSEVFRIMKLMTRALGTECSACHRTGDRDFAADTLPRKVTARAMMRMELALRDGLDWRKPPSNLCVSCHRGRLQPPAPPGG